MPTTHDRDRSEEQRRRTRREQQSTLQMGFISILFCLLSSGVAWLVIKYVLLAP